MTKKKVKCINNKNEEKYLTIGKEYEVYSINSDGFEIIADDGELTIYKSELFLM